MKQLTTVLLVALMAIAFCTACKKDKVLTQPSVSEVKVLDTDPSLSLPAPAGHLAIGPFNGVGTPYYRYAGGTTYAAVPGALGNNIIRNAMGGAPLLNVTGLAAVGNFAYCLSRPAAGVNWQIWQFPVGNPNGATLWSTINGTAAIVLSDLAKDLTANRVLALNRTGLRLCDIPFVAGATAIAASGSYSAVPNVSGLAMVGNTPFILGQSGGTGYLMKCTPALVPGWTLAMATYTPPGVPFVFTESASEQPTDDISNGFIVASQSTNWTQTIPVGAGIPAPPVWQIANVGIIDFARL